MVSKIVGLTGGIGSGKSYVSRIFSLMEVPVYDSDSNAKRLMVEDLKVINKIKSLLGENAYDKIGNLCKEYISEIIFKNPKKRSNLNDIVHPAVRKDFKKYVKCNAKHPVIINEAALFVENGTYLDFDCLLTVISPEKLRLQRVMMRDSSTEEEIQGRMQSQSSDKEKIDVSDFVIYNDASDNLFKQISEIHTELFTFVKKEKK